MIVGVSAVGVDASGASADGDDIGRSSGWFSATSASSGRGVAARLGCVGCL